MNLEKLPTNPLSLFENWFELVKTTDLKDPNAMVLSTVSPEGVPSSRVVLLKLIRDERLYFFTNYNSRKSKELLSSGRLALNFHWRAPKHRQVRIQGDVKPSSRSISEEYYSSRPRGSRIGAWSSPQSQVIKDRAELKAYVEEVEKKFLEVDEIPCPPNWGGFEVTPHSYEFWEEGDSRLHDRFLYTKKDEDWLTKRLAP